MKIALVYDRVNKIGGAERVLLSLHEIWPQAPLYTAVYNREKATWADIFKIKTSYLQKIPFSTTKHEILPLLTSLAFESFDFSEFEVVISITSSDAKAILTKPTTLHICYCLTPTRYLWSGQKDYLDEPGIGILNLPVRLMMKLFFPMLRQSDFTASRRPDYYLAISKAVEKRIYSYYKVTCVDVIHPPVNTDLFRPGRGEGGNYFLIVSRFVPYKRIDYVIETFNSLGWKLKIIGRGIDEGRLRRLAKKNIEFITSNLTDEKLCWYYQNCLALIFPGEEDFGLTAVEAQSCGKPVVGLAQGGVAESIVPGSTGELYYRADEETLTSVLKQFNSSKYSSRLCRRNALRFSKAIFQKKMKQSIDNLWFKWQQTL